MSETLTGAIGYSSSHRSGSSWLKPLSLSCTGLGGLSDAGRGVIVGDPSLTSVTACATFNNGIYGVNSIFPSSMTDRQRDKIKMSADWAATDQLSLQFMAEWGQDNFSSPGTKGLRSSYMGFYGVDAAYALSEDWKLTGYWSRGDQTMHVDHSTGYLAALRNLSDSYGFGVIGKPTSRLQVGGDLLLIDDRDEYKQRGGSTANSTLVPSWRPSRRHLPAIHAEAVRQVRSGQDLGGAHGPDPPANQTQRMDLGLQRNAVCVFRQLHGYAQAKSKRDLPRRNLHRRLAVSWFVVSIKTPPGVNRGAFSLGSHVCSRSQRAIGL